MPRDHHRRFRVLPTCAVLVDRLDCRSPPGWWLPIRFGIVMPAQLFLPSPSLQTRPLGCGRCCRGKQRVFSSSHPLPEKTLFPQYSRKLPVRREKNVTSLEILWSPTILLFHPKLCVFLLQFRAYSAMRILIDTKCNQ